jgi:hypothetical protein
MGMAAPRFGWPIPGPGAGPGLGIAPCPSAPGAIAIRMLLPNESCALPFGREPEAFCCEASGGRSPSF